MDVLMECIAVLVYVTAGYMLPLGNSQTDYKSASGQPEKLNRLPVDIARNNEYPQTGTH